jgi:hypothetical protein
MGKPEQLKQIPPTRGHPSSLSLGSIPAIRQAVIRRDELPVSVRKTEQKGNKETL